MRDQSLSLRILVLAVLLPTVTAFCVVCPGGDRRAPSAHRPHGGCRRAHPHPCDPGRRHLGARPQISPDAASDAPLRRRLCCPARQSGDLCRPGPRRPEAQRRCRCRGHDTDPAGCRSHRRAGQDRAHDRVSRARCPGRAAGTRASCPEFRSERLRAGANPADRRRGPGSGSAGGSAGVGRDRSAATRGRGRRWRDGRGQLVDVANGWRGRRSMARPSPSRRLPRPPRCLPIPAARRKSPSPLPKFLSPRRRPMRRSRMRTNRSNLTTAGFDPSGPVAPEAAGPPLALDAAAAVPAHRAAIPPLPRIRPCGGAGPACP